MDIPSSVTDIGVEAFCFCRGLKTVNLQEGLVSIQEWAFGFCNSLEILHLPDSVAKLGSFVLYGCSHLKDLYLPQALEWPGFGCFGNCDELIKIEVSQKNQKLVRDGQLLIRKDDNFPRVVFCMRDTVGTVRLKNSIAIIDDFAFESCTGVTELILSEKLMYIGYCGLHGCTGITSLCFHENYGVFSGEALKDCTSLRKVIFLGRKVYFSHSTFQNCRNLISIELPEDTDCINESLFDGCTSLEKITLPVALKKVEKNAFRNCERLTELDFPESLQSLDGAAFNRCNLKRLTFRGRVPDLDLRYSNCSVDRDGELYVDWYPFYRLSDENQKRVARGIARRVQDGTQVPEAVLRDAVPYLSDNCLALWRDPVYRPVLLKRGMLSLENYMQILEQTLKDNDDPALTAQLLEYQHRNFTQDEIDKINKKIFDITG